MRAWTVGGHTRPLLCSGTLTFLCDKQLMTGLVGLTYASLLRDVVQNVTQVLDAVAR
jgi:hypothetical protein